MRRRIQFAAADAYTAWGMQQGKVNNGGQNNYTHQADQGLTWIKGGTNSNSVGTCAACKLRARPRQHQRDLLFARAETANPAATGTTGNSFASFLLGLPDSATAAATPVQDANIHYRVLWLLFPRQFEGQAQVDAQPGTAL